MGKRIEMDLAEKEKLIQECLAGRMRMREAARRAGTPLVIAGTGDMQRTARLCHGILLFLRGTTHRLILTLLAKLSQRSPLSSSFTFFNRSSSIFNR